MDASFERLCRHVQGTPCVAWVGFSARLRSVVGPAACARLAQSLYRIPNRAPGKARGRCLAFLQLAHERRVAFLRPTARWVTIMAFPVFPSNPLVPKQPFSRMSRNQSRRGSTDATVNTDENNAVPFLRGPIIRRVDLDHLDSVAAGSRPFETLKVFNARLAFEGGKMRVRKRCDHPSQIVRRTRRGLDPVHSRKERQKVLSLEPREQPRATYRGRPRVLDVGRRSRMAGTVVRLRPVRRRRNSSSLRLAHLRGGLATRRRV